MAFNSFGTHIGRYVSTPPTLTDGCYSIHLLDSNSRIVQDHTTSSIKIGDGTDILDVLVEDAASSGGEKGLMPLAVRQDTLATSVDADGDFGWLKIDSLGALWVRSRGDYAEDSVHQSGDFGRMALTVRNDTLSQLTDTDGDYAPLQTDESGRLYVTMKGSRLEHQEDEQHTSGDYGLMPLAVRNDTEGTLAGTDGDYAPLQVDDLGRLRTTAELDQTPGIEKDVCADETGDGLVDSVGDSVFVDVVTIAVAAGEILHIQEVDGSADKLCVFQLVVWDSNEDPGSEVVKYIRKFLVPENVGTNSLNFGRVIEVAGSATISVKLQAKMLRSCGADATVSGGINAYSL